MPKTLEFLVLVDTSPLPGSAQAFLQTDPAKVGWPVRGSHALALCRAWAWEEVNEWSFEVGLECSHSWVQGPSQHVMELVMGSLAGLRPGPSLLLYPRLCECLGWACQRSSHYKILEFLKFPKPFLTCFETQLPDLIIPPQRLLQIFRDV